MDLVADSLLHHLPSVELQTWVHCLHSHCCQVSLIVVSYSLCSGICKGKKVCTKSFNKFRLRSVFLLLCVVFQLCWSASWKEASVWLWRAVPARDRSLFSEGKSSVPFYIQCVTLTRSAFPSSSSLNITLCSRLRSCTWISAPRWTLHGTETAVHVRCPPTAPGSPPTQRCRTLHVSHPLLPKVLTHSTAGQHVQKSCNCMDAGAVVLFKKR